MAARVPLPLLPSSFKKKKKEKITDEDDNVEIELEDIIIDENENNLENENNENNHSHDPTSETNDSNDPNSNENKENNDEDDDEYEDMTLEEHAMIVTTILKPVAITMIIVITIVYALNMASAPPTTVSFMIYQEKSTDSTPVKLGGAIIDATIFIILIVIVTCFLVVLYKYRCLKLIFNWLIFSCAMLLGIFGGTLYYRIFQSFNWPLDWITFCILTFNFAVVGMFSIFWRAPTKTTQFYLIAISALMACFFTRLAEWTTWTLLIAIAIYDLFAVLCPRGPLKVLVDLSQERDEPIPALLYNGSVILVGMASSTKSDSSNSSENEEETEEREESEIENIEINENQDEYDTESNEIESGTPLLSDGNNNNIPIVTDEDINDKIEYSSGEQSGGSVKLGLGDFIFYSVLMGRAAMYDITTTFTCFIGIITGLFFTLILLAIFRKALPALPISIFLGTIFYFLTRLFLVPFVQLLGTNAIFI